MFDTFTKEVLADQIIDSLLDLIKNKVIKSKKMSPRFSISSFHLFNTRRTLELRNVMAEPTNS